MPFRAFVAVEVTARPELEALLRGLDDLDAPVRVVAPDNLHVTLAFLGDVEAGEVPDVVSAVDAAAGDSAPFAFDLTGVGAFPPRGAPRVVWAGIGDDAARAHLEVLAARVRRELDDRDVAYDRKAFRAHVTIGRMKRPQGADRVRAFLDAQQDWRGGAVAVERVEVKRSTLTPRGPVYETAHAATLGADAG